MENCKFKKSHSWVIMQYVNSHSLQWKMNDLFEWNNLWIIETADEITHYQQKKHSKWENMLMDEPNMLRAFILQNIKHCVRFNWKQWWWWWWQFVDRRSCSTEFTIQRRTLKHICSHNATRNFFIQNIRFKWTKPFFALLSVSTVEK